MASEHKKRIVCLDVIKTWSMFFVLLIHMVGVMPSFPKAWWAAAFTIFTVSSVPLFLMVNGALLLNRPFSFQKWRNRLIALIVLTCIWKLIGLAFCHFFWDFDDVAVTPRIVIEYLFGGDPPYWQLKYLWFMNMYIGLYAFLPLWKHLFDCEDARYLKLGFVITLICTFGSPTFSMALQPLDTILGTGGFSTVLAHLPVFVPMSENAVYVVYFFVGGLLYRSYIHSSSSTIPTKDGMAALLHCNTKTILALGAISYAILLLLNRYQVVYLHPNQAADLGSYFTVTPNYTNAFTLFLSSALYLILLNVKYPRSIAAISETIGKRTFGIYILHIFSLFIVQITVGDHPISPFIPNGSELPPLLAMIFLLGIIAISLAVTTIVVAAIERIPLINRLLPK